jgi:hypothetical protein
VPHVRYQLRIAGAGTCPSHGGGMMEETIEVNEERAGGEEEG